MRVGILEMLGTFDADGKEIILDADGNTSITADTDDQIDIKISGTDRIAIKDGSLEPTTNNTSSLGIGGIAPSFKTEYIKTLISPTAKSIPQLAGDPVNNGDISLCTTGGSGEMGDLRWKAGGTVYVAYSF